MEQSIFVDETISITRKISPMKQLLLTMVVTMVTAYSIAQTSTNLNFGQAKHPPAMQWFCPEIEKYQGILLSLQDNDCKNYANKVMQKFELYEDPSLPGEKILATMAVMNVENPLFNSENLFDHISLWMKKNKDYKKLGEKLKIEKKKKKMFFPAGAVFVNIANHGAFASVFRVSISPSLLIAIADDNKLIISFMVNRYLNEEFGSDNKIITRNNPKIVEVYPFVPKSSHKNTYAKAYVATYLYFWKFISDLRNELNTNYTIDKKMLASMRYKVSNDSLFTLYGEPTNVISDQKTLPDVNKEMRFYEAQQKLVFMGKIINFKDILSCEVVDDPQFIPGRTTVYGGGLCIFGFGIGGAEAYSTPDKVIHNYVVDIKIDNLAIPFIRIATGQNEHKATEIASVFDYILRHQNNKNAGSQKSRVTRRTKR